MFLNIVLFMLHLFQSKLAKPNLGAKEKMAVTITEKNEMATAIEVRMCILFDP